MELFDDLIRRTYRLLPSECLRFHPEEDTSPYTGKRSELILGRETAFELGGGSFPSASGVLYTQSEELVPCDEIRVYGSDLPQIRNDCPFARFAVIRTDDIEFQGEQGAYGILENIGLRKYDVFPSGYMVRTSALSNREQVRVSKAAAAKHLSFAQVGSMYIQEFHKNPHVTGVRMIFVTLPDMDYRELDHLGTLSNQVFRALNRALADLKMDCKACEWKIVCDEVEGIKLLHQSQIDKNQ